MASAESAVEARLRGLQMGMVYLREIGDAGGLDELRGELEALSRHPEFRCEAVQLLSRLQTANRP